MNESERVDGLEAVSMAMMDSADWVITMLAAGICDCPVGRVPADSRQ